MPLPFHGNELHRHVINTLIEKCDVTSFVETGTYGGDSTSYIASKHPSLSVFTCEINEAYFKNASKKLKNFKNVKASNESSEKFITRLVSEGVLGKLPMFFLDAHWHDYWPLKDEVTIIGTLPAFILMIDDFRVPNCPWFESSSGGGGTIGVHRTQPDTRPCNMSLIDEHLPDDCLVGYPTYTKKEAPPPTRLVGHSIILHGVDLPEELDDSMYEWGSKR
jgi:hypothetical protein